MTEPPGRSRVLAWLTRPKLWDDVFTRVTSNLITLAIVGLFATAIGIVHPTHRVIIKAWATAAFFALEAVAIRLAWRGIRRPEKRLRYRLLAFLAASLAIVPFYVIANGVVPLA